MVDAVLEEQARQLLRRAGIWEVAQQVGQAATTAARGHARLRQMERARALDLDVGTAVQEEAVLDFAQAGRHAEQARVLLRERRQTAEHRAWRDGVQAQLGSPDAATSFEHARRRWVRILHTANVSAADAAEMAGMWDQVAEPARSGGVDAVFDLLEEHLGQLPQRLSEDEDFGRRPHSPLEWWQWLIIIAVLVISIAALLACLFWFGCSWIEAIFIGFCLAGGAASGGVILEICAVVAF
jgi:hypothetical protein